ncbi:MAG: M15 family metallopeptidase [Lachnospiraceae bacterium]|nr:M15 family metallopeptidase [Lachnospiraceae bacterium]
MEQSKSSRNTRRTSNKKSHKSKHAKQQQKIIILLVITFVFGFLAGLFVGLKRTQPVNFVMESSAETLETETNIKESSSKAAINNAELPWNLQLVNFEYALAADFEPESLADVDNGYVADSRIVEAAKKMISDARTNDNVRIIALSAYRDYEYQTELYENKVQRLQQENGYSVAKAREEAATVVAYPGTSEHQLGLALDLVDARHVKLDESQENTDAYKWLYEHCDEYGFIVRYPNGKTDITGIIYEPWHFRYVGEEAAKVIMEKGITLEEYLSDYYTE